MWYRLMMSAAVGSCVWLLLERIEANRLLVGWHRIGDDADGPMQAIARILESEYERHGVESRCCAARGVAQVMTTRRGHARVDAALGGRGRRTPLPQSFATDYLI